VQKLAAIGLLAAGLIHGQTKRDLMLPVARTISGVVVDTSGKPLVGFRVDHRGFGWYEAGADGKFQFDTRAPAVVFRKPGYNSYYLRTASASEVRVVLEQAVSHGGPAGCPNNAMCASIGSWGRRFCLPLLREVEVADHAPDVDYQTRSYYIDTPKGRVGIVHGSGAMWSLGDPMDQDVWSSVEYHETVFTVDNRRIVDARVRTAAGKYWRFLGQLGETASYRDADADAARILDRVLDGMCLRQ